MHSIMENFMNEKFVLHSFYSSMKHTDFFLTLDCLSIYKILYYLYALLIIERKYRDINFTPLYTQQFHIRNEYVFCNFTQAGC